MTKWKSLNAVVDGPVQHADAAHGGSGGDADAAGAVVGAHGHLTRTAGPMGIRNLRVKEKY